MSNFNEGYNLSKISCIQQQGYNPEFNNSLTPKGVSHNETPVKITQKTFEELLEEEIQKNNEIEKSRLKEPKKTSLVYLKRGQGALNTDSRASTPSYPSSYTPVNPGLATTSRIGTISAHRSASKIKKSISQSNVIKKTTIKDSKPELNILETPTTKPLNLYKIRRERWKIKKISNELQTYKTTPINDFNEDKKTFYNKTQTNEVQVLRSIVKKLTDSMKNKELYIKKESEAYLSQISELKKQNIKLIIENNKLKASIEKSTPKPEFSPISTRIKKKV
jgi:hypothetical protein